MSRFRGIDRFFAAYYIANVAIIGSYFLVRLWFLEHSEKKYSRFHGKMDMFEKVRDIPYADDRPTKLRMHDDLFIRPPSSCLKFFFLIHTRSFSFRPLDVN